MSRLLTFPYRRVLTPDGFIWLPLLVVELVRGPHRVLEQMVVDSGADMALIPVTTGRALGMSLRPGERPRWMSGIGGTVPYYPRTAWMTWNGGRHRVRLAWAQTDGVPPLLGRRDFFDRFDVCFYERRRQFRLTSAHRR